MRDLGDRFAPRSFAAHQPGPDEQAEKSARSVCNGPAELSNLAVSQDALGRHDAAEAAYRQAIALDPEFATTHHNLGNLLHKQGVMRKQKLRFVRQSHSVTTMPQPGTASPTRCNARCAYRHTGFWQPMDTLRDKTTLEALWSSGEAPWKMWRD
jgi:Tfp pilus assembly protein PilF